MDRVTLKQFAKETAANDRLNSIAAAFIMTTAAIMSGSASSTVLGGITRFGDNLLEKFAFMSLPLLIITLVGVIISFVLKILIASVIKIGGSRFFLKLCLNEKASLKEIFTNFSDGNYFHIIFTSFVREISLFLWSFLFVIPGIIKSYEYFGIDYILAIRPDLDRTRAFEISRAIMYGKKWDLFILDLSFIGWTVLSVCTCGILGIVYVYPYRQAALAEFFINAKDEAVKNGLAEIEVELGGGASVDEQGIELDNDGFDVSYNGTASTQYTNNSTHAYDARNIRSSDASGFSAPVVNEQTYSPYVPENASSADNDETTSS